jgi:16S rRNA (uracil1498-N3)-methyltransferase
LAVGDEVELFDGRGARVRAVLEDAKRARVRTLAVPALAARPPFVGLVLCMPKGHKVDDIVRMTTELGVGEIVLALSERSPTRAREDRDAHKRERLERVAIEAARQSEQSYVPRISPPLPLQQALAGLAHGPLRLALVERTDALLSPVPGTTAMWLLVGPEGGLSHRDRQDLTEAGFLATGLVPSVLRTETAAVFAVGLAMDWLFRSLRV